MVVLWALNSLSTESSVSSSTDRNVQPKASHGACASVPVISPIFAFFDGGSLSLQATLSPSYLPSSTPLTASM